MRPDKTQLNEQVKLVSGHNCVPELAQKSFLATQALYSAHGLKVLEPYNPRKPSINLGQREYRAQQREHSWKFELLYEITELMKTCGSRKEFIDRLREKGYEVRWEEQQKTMTYTCPIGMKVRDNKLHDARFMKEAMEHEFRIREQYLEQIARIAETDGTGTQRDTISADSLCDTKRPLGADAFAAAGADGISGKTVPGNETNAHSAGNDELHQLHYAGIGIDDNQSNNTGQRAAATGWEESRRVYFKAVIAAVREQTEHVQNNRYTEQEAETLLDSSAVDIGGAIGAGLGAVISLAQMSESDDPEEIKKRIEAQIAGQNLGFIIGIILAMLKEEKEERTEQQTWQHRHRQLEQFDEEEQDEEQTDEMQMM